MRLRIGLVLGLLAAAGFAGIHNVPLRPTDEDRVAATEILGGDADDILGRRERTFEEEIKIIRDVQDAVLRTAPVSEGIPLRTTREPKDLYAERNGDCYDRSRSIEKLLRLAGFETRHVAVYSVPAGTSVVGVLLTPGTPSHAVSEVLTQKEWMLIDSNTRWIGLKAGEAISVEEIEAGELPAAQGLSEPINPIFTSEFTYIYGLYSRHGFFFPPYTPVPDVNWRELLHNIS